MNTTTSVISTDSFVEDSSKRKRQIINVIYGATGEAFNKIDAEYGDLIEHCIKNNYNDRCIMGAVMERLWRNHCLDVDISDDLEEV